MDIDGYRAPSDTEMFHDMFVTMWGCYDMFHDMFLRYVSRYVCSLVRLRQVNDIFIHNTRYVSAICFTVCLFVSPDLDGNTMIGHPELFRAFPMY